MTQGAREDEWQTMMRIACEVAELPADPFVRRKHLAARVCDLLGARSAHSFEFHRDEYQETGDFQTHVSVGLDPVQLQDIRQDFADAELPECDQATGQVSECRHLYSKITLSDGTTLAVGVHRAPRDKPFTQREADVLNAFHLHAWRLYGTSMNRHKLDPILDSLPRRLRTVLDELLRTGDSEKQIAARLKLSRHTVHEYVKSIYERLGVNSRAELMHRFSASAQQPKPKQSERLSLAS